MMPLRLSIVIIINITDPYVKQLVTFADPKNDNTTAAMQITTLMAKFT